VEGPATGEAWRLEPGSAPAMPAAILPTVSFSCDVTTGPRNATVPSVVMTVQLCAVVESVLSLENRRSNPSHRREILRGVRLLFRGETSLLDHAGVVGRRRIGLLRPGCVDRGAQSDGNGSAIRSAISRTDFIVLRRFASGQPRVEHSPRPKTLKVGGSA
jgi:hypothetical protein